MWYTPAERNRFTGEPITRTIQVRKTIISEETEANVVVVMYLTKAVVALHTTTESNVTAVTEIAGIRKRVGTTIGNRETMTSESRSDRPKMIRATTENEATKIIITETTGGIAIARGIDAGTATGKGIGDIPEMTGQRIDTETSVRVTTRRRIARDRGRDRGIARHRCSGR